MYKVMFAMLAIMVMGGCSAMDATYGKGKAVYNAGKAVVKVIPGESTTLKAVDGVAVKYDEFRTEVRGK